MTEISPTATKPPRTSGLAPKVSVLMITYNHEQFIAQAIESVIMQEANFEFELVIGEDCSSDRTPDVVRRYQEKYPAIIKPIFHQKNVGMMSNFEMTRSACEGEYIAILEGDDYWTDTAKLQLQAESLDARPELSLCHTKTDYLRMQNGVSEVIAIYPPEALRRELTRLDLIESNPIATCSVMFRSRFYPANNGGNGHLELADWPLWYLLSEQGPIGFIDRSMATYRMHPGGAWSTKCGSKQMHAFGDMFYYLAALATTDRELLAKKGLKFHRSAARQRADWRGALNDLWYGCRFCPNLKFPFLMFAYLSAIEMPKRSKPIVRILRAASRSFAPESRT